MRRVHGCGSRFVINLVVGGYECAEGLIHTDDAGPLRAKVLPQRQRQVGSTSVWRTEQRNQRGFLHVYVGAVQSLAAGGVSHPRSVRLGSRTCS